jgi:hypothetical protein
MVCLEQWTCSNPTELAAYGCRGLSGLSVVSRLDQNQTRTKRLSGHNPPQNHPSNLSKQEGKNPSAVSQSGVRPCLALCGTAIPTMPTTNRLTPRLDKMRQAKHKPARFPGLPRATALSAARRTRPAAGVRVPGAERARGCGGGRRGHGEKVVTCMWCPVSPPPDS